MLQKSLGTGSDVIIYDLEDSVAPSPDDKANARANLKKFLKVCSQRTGFVVVLIHLA
jgi:citrate lyase subunit beta-like protein